MIPSEFVLSKQLRPPESENRMPKCEDLNISEWQDAAPKQLSRNLSQTDVLAFKLEEEFSLPLSTDAKEENSSIMQPGLTLRVKQDNSLSCQNQHADLSIEVQKEELRYN